MIAYDSKDFFKISKTQYFYYLFFVIICFFSYYYMDIESTTRWGINIWKSLFEGKILKFYSCNANNSFYGVQHAAGYEMPLYIVFALWNIPLAIFEAITKQNSLTNIFCIIYSKGILILFFILTTKSFFKICDIIGFPQEKKHACTFFWMTSFFVIESLFVICEYDIIYLFFILNGIVAYMQNNTKQFLLWFATALPFKMFALFVFLPLLLIKEKNIFKILFALICCIFPLLLFKGIFTITDPIYKNLPRHPAINYIFADAQFFSDCYLNRNNTLHLPMGNPTIFVTIYSFFIGICYFFVNKSDNFITIFISAVSFSLVFAFSWVYPYWIILLSPFICLLCFYSKSQNIIYKNLLFEMIFSGAYTFAVINIFFLCFNSSSLLHLLLRYNLFKIIPEKFPEIAINFPFLRTGWKYEIQTITSKSEYITVPIAVAVYTVFLIMFLMYVYKDYTKPETNENTSPILFSKLNPYIWVRTSITGFVAIAQVLMVIISRIRI